MKKIYKRLAVDTPPLTEEDNEIDGMKEHSTAAEASEHNNRGETDQRYLIMAQSGKNVAPTTVVPSQQYMVIYAHQDQAAGHTRGYLSTRFLSSNVHHRASNPSHQSLPQHDSEERDGRRSHNTIPAPEKNNK